VDDSGACGEAVDILWITFWGRGEGAGGAGLLLYPPRYKKEVK